MTLKAISITRCSGTPVVGYTLAIWSTQRVIASTYVVVGQAVRLPAQTASHLGETLGLDEVVESKRREHGAVAVDVCLDEQGGAADAVEVDHVALVAVDICEKALVVV